MNEQNPLTPLICFLFLKGPSNPSEDRKQQREGTIIIMTAHYSVKVAGESTGCILEASLSLLISTLFQGGPGRKSLRSSRASLSDAEPYQEGRENGKGEKGREWMSTKKGLFLDTMLNLYIYHLI